MRKVGGEFYAKTQTLVNPGGMNRTGPQNRSQPTQHGETASNPNEDRLRNPDTAGRGTDATHPRQKPEVRDWTLLAGLIMNCSKSFCAA